jgi:hypothetical protein
VSAEQEHVRCPHCNYDRREASQISGDYLDSRTGCAFYKAKKMTGSPGTASTAPVLSGWAGSGSRIASDATGR